MIDVPEPGKSLDAARIEVYGPQKQHPRFLEGLGVIIPLQGRQPFDHQLAACAIVPRLGRDAPRLFTHEPGMDLAGDAAPERGVEPNYHTLPAPVAGPPR